MDVGVVDNGCCFRQLDMVASEVFLMSLGVSWQWVSPRSDGFQTFVCCHQVMSDNMARIELRNMKPDIPLDTG